MSILSYNSHLAFTDKRTTIGTLQIPPGATLLSLEPSSPGSFSSTRTQHSLRDSRTISNLITRRKSTQGLRQSGKGTKKSSVLISFGLAHHLSTWHQEPPIASSTVQSQIKRVSENLQRIIRILEEVRSSDPFGKPTAHETRTPGLHHLE